MARFVNFGGQTLFKPGGLTRINANALAPIGLSATGIVALVGESEDGAPNVLTTIDDPSLAVELFGSGSLTNAVNIAFNPSADPRVPGGAFRCICYKTNQSTQSGTHLPGATTLIADTVSSATTTAITVVTGGLVVSAHIGRWLKISGEKRRITANTATVIMVSPAFSVAPVATTAIAILNDEILLTSKGYGSSQNQISVELETGVGTDTSVVTIAKGTSVNQSPDLGGTPFLLLEYIGGAIPANGSGPITAATTSTVSYTAGSAPGLNAFAGMVLQFADGTQRLIQGNTAAASPCVVTLDSAHVITAAQAVAFVGTSVAVRNVTSATASITGTFGTAKTLVSVIAPVADNLNITFGPAQTLRQLVDNINATSNYRATIPVGVNADTTLMSSFDFGTRATTVDVRFDQGITPSTKGNFRRDLQVVIDWINTFSTLATAVRSTAGTSEGGQIPDVTGGVAVTIQDFPVYFIGGTRGISASSNFQAGLDALLQVRVNHVVPLCSENLTNEGFGSTAIFTAVAAQLSDHCHQTSGIARSERGGYLGMKGTRNALIAEAAAINNTDVALFGQQITVLDAVGNLVVMPEWAQAVTAAGMRSGVDEVGEPLTFKFLNASGLIQDSSWSPRSITDVNALIQGGVMFAESPPQGGFRFVRDMTTYIIDANIAFVDGNTRDAVRFVAYDLRTTLEEEFTGLKAKPAVVQNIRSTVVAKMELYLQQSIIVNSLDPETESKIVPGYRNLRVFVRGNVATIKAEIFPVTGILFQLSDIYLQLPILSA